AGAARAAQAGPDFLARQRRLRPHRRGGGMAMWQLEVEGVTGHSGMTHNCVNALELSMAATLELVGWFRSRYVPHPEEAGYGFLTPSTLKPTVIQVENTKISKIPGSARVEGDLRLTPFYDMHEA